MILQELIQKNKRLLRQVLNSQSKNERISKNNQLCSDSLPTKKLTADTFNLKSFLLDQKNQEKIEIARADSYSINGQKYLFMREMSNKIIK